MAETTIGSAIAVTESNGLTSSEANTLKRRQSDEADGVQEWKRQRISPGKNSPVARDDAEGLQAAKHDTEIPDQEQPKADTRERRRKSSLADEKQRSKRLFGALLGSLNQPGDRTSKRRQEIESRRKAELQRQDDERVEDKLRQQEQLTERRRKEQIKVNEQNMRIRHSNMLHAANFLQTTTEPKLYYRPWDLRPDEDDRIDAQIKEAQSRIDKELDEFEQRHRWNGVLDDQHNATQSPSQPRTKSPEQIRSTQQQSPPKSYEEAGKTTHAGGDVEDPAAAKSDDSKPAEVPDSESTNFDTNNTITHEPNNDQIPVAQIEKASEVDIREQEDGDHVVEGDEDTVIY